MKSRRSPAARALSCAVALAALLGAAGCGTAGSGDEPRVVVTTSILGAVVRDVVGEAAQVRVVMPNGADPHDYAPSARDVEALTRADLVVANGAGLEAPLEAGLDEARRSGVPVVLAADHVTPPAGAEEDPHLWMDPLAMRDVAVAVASAAEMALRTDLGARPARAAARLEALVGRVRRALAPIPPDRRELVTGHESMAWFAARFGFRRIGAVVPSLSTQAEASAGALADLRRRVAAEGVPAVFTEAGTPPGVAEALAREIGARVVEVPAVALPDDGSYATFMDRVARAVVSGLGPDPR